MEKNKSKHINNKKGLNTKSKINMKKIFLTLILSIFLIGLGSSTLESLGTFKQNQEILINQVCDDATWINISSITFPNSTSAVSNIPMISLGNGRFGYNFTQTASLGKYDVLGVSDGTCEDTFSYYFKVTEGGDEFGTPQTIILIGQFCLIVMFLVIGFSFKPEKWKLRTFFFIFALFMGVLLLNSMRIIVGTSTNLALMGTIGLITGIIVLSFMFLYLLINYTIEVFHYFKERSRMRWSIGEV
jgi:hypothetical protein